MKRLSLILCISAFISAIIVTPACAQDNESLFKKPFMIKVDGEILDTGEIGHAAPWLYDFDGDSKNDLLVGYFGSRDKEDKSIQGGKLLIFYNTGTNKEPKYQKGEFFKIDGKLGTVPSG